MEKYNIIYKIIRDEEGEVVDLSNEYEFKTQNEVGKYFNVDRSYVSRATIKSFTSKHVSECTPIKYYGAEYVIIRG